RMPHNDSLPLDPSTPAPFSGRQPVNVKRATTRTISRVISSHLSNAIHTCYTPRRNWHSRPDSFVTASLPPLLERQDVSPDQRHGRIRGGWLVQDLGEPSVPSD